MVYIDESGVDHNCIKTNCWAKRGAKVIGERSGKRRLRTSVIAALNGENINAPMRFNGTSTTALFLAWLENILLPTLLVGQVVIMDNCSIHKSPRVKELIESVGCRLIYLTPYSPDLNPIENYWAVMKNQIKKKRDNFANILDTMDAVLMNTKRAFQS
jgi:transposase